MVIDADGLLHLSPSKSDNVRAASVHTLGGHFY